MDIERYLQRIGSRGSRAPAGETLAALQNAHLQTVPFENLDISPGRPIRLELPALYDKIVVRRRGGFCYELNGLFAWLLESLGFDVTLMSARDVHPDGSYGPEHDHLALLVGCPMDGSPAGGATRSPAAPERWLVDVGWGDSFTTPLSLDDPGVQEQGRRAYRIDCNGDERMLWQRDYDGTWERQYVFTLRPHRLSDFEAMCLYHQTSPESWFTRKRIVTRATPNGRVSLEGDRLIVTIDGNRAERPVGGEDEFRALLLEHFSIGE